MNILQFTAELAVVELTTRVSELEAFIRKYAQKSTYVYVNSESDFIKHSHPYRILSSALHKHSQISTAILPDFIFNYHRSAGQRLFGYLFSDPVAKCDYDMFVRIFTDTTHLDVKNLNECTFVSFSELVQDRPNPIHKLTIDTNLTGYHSYIGGAITDRSSRNHGKIISIFYLEYVLRHLSNPDKSKYVFINEMLTKLYSEVTDTPVLDTIEHQATNTLESLTIVRARLGI